MHSRQTQKEQGLGSGYAGAFGWFYVLLCSHANAIIVFTRSGFGAKHFGLSGTGSVVLFWLYAGLTNSPGMVAYFLSWIAMLLYRRLESWIRWRRGMRDHSRYDGRPWLGLRFVKDEKKAKVVFEPMLCVIIGPLLMPWSVPVGTFILAGFLSVMLKGGIEREIDRQQIVAMNDLQIEQRLMSGRFRGEIDDI